MTGERGLKAEGVVGAQPSEEPEEQAVRREAAEKRLMLSVARGLVALGLLALLASMARAGLDRVFVHGWWRQW
jgi:hypothetical protein